MFYLTRLELVFLVFSQKYKFFSQINTFIAVLGSA
jgi:hypothetical protein